MNWYDLKPLDLSKIETVQFGEDQYYKEVYPKRQIVLHHTISSGDSINGDISTWEDDPVRIAVCIIIDKGGTPWQLFSSRYWAYHLGTKKKSLNKYSIGIELDSWGQLTPTSNGKFKTYYGNEVYAVVQYYPEKFRGYHYFEKYTDAQLITLGELLLYWNKVYKIPLTYREEMWDLSQSALAGESGVFSHVSYRIDKSDCHPQSELISMLKAVDELTC